MRVAMRRRGQYGDAIVPTPRFAGQDAVGLLYLATCIAAIGLPPLSGFIGKLLMLRATVDARSSACTNSDSLLTTRAVRHDRTTYQHLAYYSRCARVPLEGVGWSPLHAQFYHPLFGPPHAIFALAIIAR